MLSAFALVALGATSGIVATRLYLSEPLLCLAAGVIAGPATLDWIDPDGLKGSDARVLVEAARVTLAIAVTSAAIRLPKGYVRSAWRELSVVLGLGMPLMAAVTALLAALVFGWPLVPSLLVGAILAPTDPVLSASIASTPVARRHVPARLRHSLSAESGLNDGLALILILFAAALHPHPDAAGMFGDWLARAWLYDIGLATVIGATAGWIAGHLLEWARHQRDAEHPSLITVAIALALLVLSAAHLLGADGILACFVAAAFLNEKLPGERDERQEHFNAAVGRMLELPFFLVLGASLPWTEWRALAWTGATFAVLVLVLRRPPAWLLLQRWLPSVRDRREALFAGWFGPVGIAAVFYALEWRDRAGVRGLWPAVSLVVAVSIVLHGVTGTPFARRLLRRS